MDSFRKRRQQPPPTLRGNFFNNQPNYNQEHALTPFSPLWTTRSQPLQPQDSTPTVRFETLVGGALGLVHHMVTDGEVEKDVDIYCMDNINEEYSENKVEVV